MKHYRFTGALCALSLVMGSIPSVSFGAAAQAAIKIEQISPESTGTWTMISSDGAIRTSDDPGIQKLNYSFAVTDYGPTTLSVVPPPGMSVKITVYRGGEQVGETDAQQYSFTLVANDNYRFVLQYSFTKLGSIGITSDPSGLRFRMKGPTGRTYSARSPRTFTNIPAGRYTVLFPATNGCTGSTKQSAVVEPDSRNTLHVSLASCNATESTTLDYSRIGKRQLREMAEQREFKPRGERK